MKKTKICFKNSFLSILISFLIIITAVMPSLTSVSFAYVNEENTIKGSNGFIEYLVDKNDGRFIIRSQQGIPQKTEDDNKKLLFERDNDPETSFTTFRVNGKDYIFGNKYSGLSEYIGTNSMSDGLYTESRWSVDGLDIKQILEVIEDPEHPNVGNVRIRYEVKNSSDKPKNVGSRIFLDTMLADNDGAAFVVSGDTITNETELTGDEVPDFYRSSDNEISPKIIGYGFLKGWGKAPPDRIVFAHYNNLAASKWGYTVDETLNFSTEQNKYKSADSSVAYYFNESSLAVNEVRIYETFYGIGDFSHYDSNSDYAVIVNVPEKLTVNSNKTGYVEDEFTVSVTLDNSLPASKNLTGVAISLVKRDFIFTDVPGQKYTLEEPYLAKGEIKTYEFKLSAKNSQVFLSEAIRADVKSDNNTSAISGYDYILLPAISGELPDLRLDVISPSTVYYEGYREFAIKGKGFLLLENKRLWDLYLVNEANDQILIPDESINIENDEKLTISIYEDTLDSPTPVGDYRFKIVHSSDTVGTVISPTDKLITFSSDEKYQSRPYGVLFVEKRKETIGTDEYNFTYHLGVVDSVEELNVIKESLESQKSVPAFYKNAQRDNLYGPVEEIIFDVVGDIAELKDGDEKYYTVKANNKAAIINSVLQYQKGASEPMKIMKAGDMITIEGNGTLQIVSGNEVWWTYFYTYIADGIDYDMNEIIEEPEEDEAEEDDEEESKSNITIDFFDPGKVLTDITNIFFDGFEVEINNIILLNEGASFGGKIMVEVPYGAPVPVEKTEKDIQKEKEEEENELFAAINDMFLSDEERAAKYKKYNRSKAFLKISALLITEDGIFEKIRELKEKSSAPPSEKAEVIYDLILSSPELLQTIYAAIRGQVVEKDDDEDRKSVGVAIDVKKVIVGKRYGEDYIYDSVRCIGIDAEGEVKVVLPFGTQEDRDEAEEDDEVQGVSAKVAVNTIEGEYSLEANVNLEIVNAYAYISIVRVEDKLVPDHLEFSGGFDPGIPLAPPFYINKVGGGVKNLSGQFGNKDSGPLTIILILGINFVPSFKGDFRVEANAIGFSLEGKLGFKDSKMEVFEKVKVALQWARPIYFEAEAEVNLFDIIDGGAYLYVGEKVVEKDTEEDTEETYKFYFEGRIEAGVKIPDDVWFVGGEKIGSVKLGVSTEKFWGSVKVIGVGVSITYVYGKKVNIKVADANMPVLASLTNVSIPNNSIYSTTVNENDELIVGSNIKKIGSINTPSKGSFGNYLASIDSRYIPVKYNLWSDNLFASGSTNEYLYSVYNKDNILIELKYQDQVPNLTVTDPSGNNYPLVEGDNYLIKSGSVFISAIEPEDGEWIIHSDIPLEGDVYEAQALPEIKSVTFDTTGDVTSGDTVNVEFTSTNNDNALVSLFLVDTENIQEAGYALTSNIDANLNSAIITIPEGAQEGTYKIRATIQHPDYGYSEILSEESLAIIDPYKPSGIEGLLVNYIGDGYFKATWNEVIEEDGKVEYYVTVYDSNNQNVPGFTSMIVKEPKIIVGGSYTGIDELGNDIHYSLETGKSYKVGITPVKVRAPYGSSIKTIHAGTEELSQDIIIRVPEPPQITISYKDEFYTIDNRNYFASNNVDVVFDSSQSVDTDVTVDGEYFATFRNKRTFTLPLEFVDGEHAIKFISKNVYGDTKSKVVSFVTDTTKPELMIDSPGTSVISEDGTVFIKGMVESGAKVFVNDQLIAVDAKGSFESIYTIAQNSLKESVVIKAKDNVGNETVYITEAVNGTIKPITEISIKKQESYLEAGSKKMLQVSGFDEAGREVILQNKDIEFSIIKGNGLGNISKDGELTAYDEGTIVVAASYALTDSYSLQDATNLEIRTVMDYIQIIPEISQLEVGQSVALKLVGGSKYEEISLPDKNAVFTIIEGHDLADISDRTLTAKAEGNITVKAEYDDGVYHFTDELSIKIVPKSAVLPPDNDNDNNNKHQGGVKKSEDSKQKDFREAAEINIADAILEQVWKNLVEKERDLEILSVRSIRQDLNTTVTMHNIGKLNILQGTLDKNDQFLVGIDKNTSNMLKTPHYKLRNEVVELTFKDSRGKLNKPIELVFEYDKESVENPENLGIYYYNNKFGTWQYLGGEIDQKSGEVRVGLNHLSKYALIENTSDDKFIDIAGHFSENYAKSLFSLDVIAGELSGGYRYYSPDRNLTRMELTAIAVKVYEKLYPEKAEIELDSAVIFEDGNEIPVWGKDFIKKAANYGLIKGIEANGKTYFMPNKPITRAEAFTITSNAIGGKKIQVDNTFTDSASIPQWSEEHILKLVHLGFVSGYPDGTIRADKNITRGEIAAIVYQWIEGEGRCSDFMPNILTYNPPALE